MALPESRVPRRPLTADALEQIHFRVRRKAQRRTPNFAFAEIFLVAAGVLRQKIVGSRGAKRFPVSVSGWTRVEDLPSPDQCPTERSQVPMTGFRHPMNRLIRASWSARRSRAGCRELPYGTQRDQSPTHSCGTALRTLLVAYGETAPGRGTDPLVV